MNPQRHIARVLQRAAHDADVLAVMLYGSAARGEASATSDVDVCLVLTPERRTSAQMSAKRLEYVQEVELDVQVFQQLPLYIRQRVLKAAGSCSFATKTRCMSSPSERSRPSRTFDRAARRT